MYVTLKGIESPVLSNKKMVKSATLDSSKEAGNYENLMEEAHLTALKIRQEKEAEIRRIQEHWKSQLQNLTNHVSWKQRIKITS